MYDTALFFTCHMQEVCMVYMPIAYILLSAGACSLILTYMRNAGYYRFCDESDQENILILATFWEGTLENWLSFSGSSTLGSSTKLIGTKIHWPHNIGLKSHAYRSATIYRGSPLIYSQPGNGLLATSLIWFCCVHRNTSYYNLTLS